MIRVGQAPYLECSSKGDQRFSAFYAKVNGTSIEDLYQGAKRINGTTGHTRKEAKGKKAENAQQCALYYAYLWDTYIATNPQLWPTLLEATGFSDIFGQDGHVCQATELYRIKRGWLPHMMERLNATPRGSDQERQTRD